jgi:methyltransferase
MIAFLLALVFIPMALEAMRAAQNDLALRRMGAVEPEDDVFGVMQVVYPACFAAMLAEGWTGGAGTGRLFGFGLAIFVAAKALKYWAITALGVRWTFRVLVPPGSARTLRGPYRLLRHPNYLAVAGELMGMTLMARAPVTGVMSVVGFGLLMIARIRVENRALDAAGRRR